MSDLSFETIASYFHLPINEASKELKVCATILKKVCRANGISRWPHRKIRSLENMIKQLQEQIKNSKDEQEIQRLQSEIRNFEEKKDFLTRNPNVSYKSVVPKSTLQSFSKNKAKIGKSKKSKTGHHDSESDSDSDDNLDYHRPSSEVVYNTRQRKDKVNLRCSEDELKNEEEVLMVLTNLSNVDHTAPIRTVNNSKTSSSTTPVYNNDENNGNQGNRSPVAKHKFILPLKKEILKIEREKERLRSLQIEGQLSNLVTPYLHPYSLPSLDSQSLDELAENAIKKLSDSIDELPTRNPLSNSSTTIQVISFDHSDDESSAKKSSSKKRNYDDFDHHDESLNDFNKQFNTSIKYQKVWEQSSVPSMFFIQS